MAWRGLTAEKLFNVLPGYVRAIRRLYYGEHWKLGTIAAQLGLHRETVRAAVEHESGAGRRGVYRPSALDPYLPFIRDTLAQYPRLRATRIHEMVRQRGYPGSVNQLRRIVKRLRPETGRTVYRRGVILAGASAQVDWGSFGKIRIGHGTRAVSGFVTVQREAQLVAGAPPGPDVRQVFVAQGVVPQQVRAPPSPVLRSARLALVAQRIKVNAAFTDSQRTPFPWAPMVRIADAWISSRVARAGALPDRIAITFFAMRVAIPGAPPDSVAATRRQINRIAEPRALPNGIPVTGAPCLDRVAVAIAVPDRVAIAVSPRGVTETGAFTPRIPGAPLPYDMTVAATIPTRVALALARND